jgi:hypothetical protein
MKMNHLLCLLCLTLFLSACSAPGWNWPGAIAPTPTPAESDLRASAELTAKTFLALALGLTTEEVTTIRIESVDWPSSCLGLSHPGVDCAPNITPGYRLILEAQGQRFEYHTNANGSAYVPIDPVYVPEIAIAAARQVLAGKLLIPENEINVVRVNMVAWPDTCLNLVKINDVCLQQTSYGYDIVLEAQTKTYEFHVTDDGETIREK